MGRLGRGSQLLATGNGGTFTRPLDLRAFPQPLGAVAVEGWRSLYFQGWFRDVMGGASTSNFTAAMRVDVTGTFADTVFSDPAVPSNQGVSDHLIDFDADGFVDVVRMRRLPNVLEVRRNEGGLRFGELESFPLPSPQFKFDLADFDGDGDVDLLGANPGAFTVHWNEGAAGFVADAPLMTCGSLGPIRAADLDRDGRTDLIWACNTGQRLLVFFNEGLRVFSAAQAISLPANPQHMELADVDGDSQLDIVVASENATLHVVHNLGARVFAPAALSVTSGPAVALDVSDIDGDGDVDFATVEEATGRVTVSLNVAGHVASAVVLETGDVAHGVAIGDVDGDGVADIAVTGNEEAAVRVLRGLGGTAFMPPTVHPAGLNPSELTLLDLDHDGDDEAFVRNDRSYFTSILVGGPLGYAGYPPQYAAPVLTPLFQNEPASPLVAGDFDEDGDIDLIAGSVFGPFVLLTNRGDGTFQPHTPIPVPTGADHARVADLDADGHLDLAVVASTTGRVVRAYLGDGTGHFIAGPETPYLSNDPDDMAVADVNGDGHLDIAFPDFGQVVFHGDGTGAFAALTRHSDISDRWLSLAYGDLDGDGLLDAVGGRRSAGTLVVMYGNAPGSFDPPVVIGLAKDSVLVEDFDADGRLDLAGLRDRCNVCNVGSRAFVLTQALTGISQETAAAADLNGDGLPEIVSTMDYGARFTVAHNEGFGELSLRELFGQGDFPGAFALEDLDGDGTRDLAVLDDAKGKVTVYLNRAR
ncbi:MAG: VCBS repeat-containing protein [Planctomycetota bacterium]